MVRYEKLFVYVTAGQDILSGSENRPLIHPDPPVIGFAASLVEELVAIVAVDGVCQTDNFSRLYTLCSSSDDRETNGMSRMGQGTLTHAKIQYSVFSFKNGGYRERKV